MKSKEHSHLKASRWLIAVFGVVALCLVIGGASIYRREKEAFRSDEARNLQVIVRLKADALAQWRAERLADAAVILASPFLREAVAAWLKTPNRADSDKILEHFAFVARHYDYRDILLVDASGQVRLSIMGRSSRLHEKAFQALDTALRERQAVLSMLHAGPDDLPPHIDVVAPIIARTNDQIQAVGAIILQADANAFLYPLITSWPVPSATAESLLVQRDGDNALFLNELRHQRDTALKLRIPLTQTEVPAVSAILGKEGIVEGRDYRGVEVVSVLQAVPSSEWFLVCKVDAAEVFAPLRARAWATSIIVSLLILIVALALAFALYQPTAELRESERNLRIEKEYAEKLLNAPADTVFVFEPATGRAIRWNEVFRIVSGYSNEEIASLKAPDAYYSQDDLQRARDAISKILKEGRGTVELTLITKGGKLIPFEYSASVVADSTGAPRFLISIGRDLTERKQAERHREELIAELQKTIAEIKTLRGIIPVCMHCKGIRNDKGYWDQLEVYLSEHSEAMFSHGICDKCLKEHYSDI